MDHYLDELLKPDAGNVTLTTDDGRTMHGELGVEIDEDSGDWFWYVRTDETRFHFLEEDVLSVDHDARTIAIRA